MAGFKQEHLHKGAVVPCIKFLWKVGLRPEILQVTEGEEPLWCDQSQRLYTLSVFSYFCASSNHSPINILREEHKSVSSHCIGLQPPSIRNPLKSPAPR